MQMPGLQGSTAPVIMPSQGAGQSMLQAPMMDYRNVPERYQDAMAAGLGFFEVRLAGIKKGFNPRLFGPFDVRCESITGLAGQGTNYNTKWLTGHAAGIEYQLTKQDGIAIAFMPDDKFWHNRVYACDNPILYNGVYSYQHATGIRQAAEIRFELDALKKVISEEVEIWKIMRDDDREMTFFPRKRGAERELKRYENSYPNRDFEVVRGVTLGKKQEILNMIKMYSNLDYGWTSCPDFDKVKEATYAIVEAGIKQSTPAAAPAAQVDPNMISQIVVNTIKNMTPEQLDDLRTQAETVSGSTNAKSSWATKAGIEDLLDESSGLFVSEMTEKELKAVKYPDLKKLCAKLGMKKLGPSPKKDDVCDILIAFYNENRPQIEASEALSLQSGVDTESEIGDVT